MFLPEKTVRYKTYLKHVLVEGLGAVFASHPDPMLSKTKVTVEFPNTAEKYPAVVVRFNERDIVNAGVGHVEFLYNEELGKTVKYRHSFYHGTIIFSVYALSSFDRDLISDTLVQTIQQGDINGYTRQFLTRIYDPALTTYPDANDHFVNLNHDVITGGSEGQMPATWGGEDDLVYTTNYSVPTFGEFYSVPPDTVLQRITQVNIYPYISDLEAVPTGVVDEAVWE